jgi:hypothetical protein
MAISLQLLFDFELTLPRKTAHTFQKKFYETIHSHFQEVNYVDLTRVIMSTHFYLLLKYPFNSSYDFLLNELANELHDKNIISTTDVFRRWKMCRIGEDTLDKKWNKLFREIRNNLCSYFINSILNPTSHLLHHSDVCFHSYITYICDRNSEEFIPTIGADMYTSWMSFTHDNSEANKEIGPMETLVKYVKLFHSEFEIIMSTSLVIKIPNITDILKTTIPTVEDFNWLNAAINLLMTIIVPALTEMDDEDNDSVNELVQRIIKLSEIVKCNHSLMLTLTGFIVPIDKKDKVSLPIPLSKLYGVLVPFEFSGKFGRNVRQQFLYQTRFEYLTWFHIVSTQLTTFKQEH